MPRLAREYLDGDVYHLTARGIPELPVLGADTDRQDFAIRLRRSALAERWELHAVCLMDTHYHLVVRAGGDRIPRGMRVLNGAYARAFNARHQRRGSVFEGRYDVTPVRDEEHLAATVLYVEANPVRAGIVDTVEDWPWSTHTASPLRELLKRCLTP
jgi:REP element-mobilizing transposase RayT